MAKVIIGNASAITVPQEDRDRLVDFIVTSSAEES